MVCSLHLIGDQNNRPVMCWPGDAQEGERGPDEDGEDGQEDPQRQEGVDKQEGVQAVEEAVGHELF